MKDHPPALALRALASFLSEEQRDLFKHLARCAHCRHNLESILADGAGLLVEKLGAIVPWPGRAEGEHGRSIAAAESLFLAHAESLAVERAEAPARLAELLEQPAERREILVRNQHRFQTWGLLERLLEHAWELCFADPKSVEPTSHLTLTLADTLDVGYYGAERIQDLRARAWGYIGNARRIRFELRDAEEAFKTAFSYLRDGTGDYLELGILLELQASLFRAQRRFPAAERLLQRASRIYRKVGETHRVGRALISLAIVYDLAGTPEKSTPLLSEALELIEPEREPRLLLSAHQNLITNLVELGRFMEAQGLFIQARPLFARFSDRWMQNRRTCLAGRIARGLGQAERAERDLQAALTGFIEESESYEAALVSLELAALYAEQDRSAELKQTAEQMLAIFTSQNIHREALAALSFLHQAVVAERASLEVVTGVAGFLKRLQYDSSLSFNRPADQ